MGAWAIGRAHAAPGMRAVCGRRRGGALLAPDGVIGLHHLLVPLLDERLEGLPRSLGVGTQQPAVGATRRVELRQVCLAELDEQLAARLGGAPRPLGQPRGSLGAVGLGGLVALAEGEQPVSSRERLLEVGEPKGRWGGE